MLNDVLKFRETKKALYTLSADNYSKFEYLPWTASSGKNGKDVLPVDNIIYLFNISPFTF